ncbi:protein translocase subunit secA [Murinocardiopsis flavida]|uniref:Protein translocase subunit SecA n=1 Tax=Murinocardiopsis flavida TaxID=645275 RepID=A0A2P8DIS1_9ACTN|nr:preprotein translocase subunit SecA [Murinocardiopsis flavida]PSK97126.1 protein translocase subunit secA [Murinocardiopsis flavida]
MPGILDKVLRAGEGKILRKLKKLKDQINSIEDDYVDLSDADLRELTDEYKQRYEDGESLDDLLPEAFATVREAAKRTLGQRHFDVQLMGGAALHLGNIAEMKTGEGKTLTATLPVYLNALSGKGVHVVTTNDYLARRDAENMGRIYQFLGMEVGVIVPDMSNDERRKAYLADITHGTNNEFGFDYLRDNMALSKDDLVQRQHHYAIVDEVDSILIDEARTPLIISGPAEQNSRWYSEFAKIAPRLRGVEVRDQDNLREIEERDGVTYHYEYNLKKRTVGITEAGVAKVEDWLGIENLYEAVNTPLISFLNNSLKAKELFKRDKEYVVKDGEVLIVDEFTGRVLAGRRYNEGMHQAIEAKEKVRIKDENQTLAKVTLQNYFRLYEKLAGMTGTATTEAAEFNQTYDIGVVPISTNMPMVRTDRKDIVYKNEEVKFDAVVDDIAECHEKGQPVLVGTTSVEKSELLSKLLKRKGIPHEVLNAKNHAREASIIARAGKLSSVTVATNMAGRGTDIMLGGNPEFMADEELQARGLAPLETPEDYEEAWPAALEKAKQEFDEEHEQVVDAGGLYVLGTERHESRRIDNQLRGRSGRQGDPGMSRFYLSLQDDLMRLFNSARVEIIMERLKIPEDQPIEHGVVSKAIMSAQGQVEVQNFEIRKNVLKYDEVMDRQRKVIYAERRKVLDGADLQEQVEAMLDDVLEGYVRQATAEGDAEDWDLERLWKAFGQVYPVSFTADELVEDNGGEISTITPDILIQRVTEDARSAYARREEELGAENMREVERRVILQVMDRKWREHLYEMDYLQEGIGLRAMAQRNPLIEYQREGFDMFQEMLASIKEEAVGFLFNVEVQVNNKEDDSEVSASSAAATAAAKAGALAAAVGGDTAVRPGSGDSAGSDEDSEDAEGDSADAESDDAAAAAASDRPDLVVPGFGEGRPGRLDYSAPSETGGVEKRSETVDDAYAGTSRNAPCPCGSGKKYKKCHGAPNAK